MLLHGRPEARSGRYRCIPDNLDAFGKLESKDWYRPEAALRGHFLISYFDPANQLNNGLTLS